ncbi:helix-turn-helix domain-containing protein [Chondrinema litorale]|uniref:helix-turn-helix domain-containing protein n=1 Tax=Chondrinema litorale TaxID=2994555 RepID=UPI0025430434|nr:helix-turn-helix domain-containing protein [Chondrinema litorale]UZR96365.1 helix-turn-helix transcriptional regulator [Chondrinema litorale]
MHKKTKSIPLNTMPDSFSHGIAVAKVTAKDLDFDKIKQAHRDDYHLFFLLEEGTALFEIDFQKYRLEQHCIMYIQPFQVHRGLSVDNVEFYMLIINNESLNSEYLQLLKDIAPAQPLPLTKEVFSIISETTSLCLKFYNRKHEKLHPLLLRDSCNSLVALIISQYLVKSKSIDTISRFELITKKFRSILDSDFMHTKSPTDFAKKLNISNVYLNECVKKVTEKSVSYHIQQRVILEAKRLLYHSNKSVKEIAFELGYYDYPYFSRLFKKVTGMTALSFRCRSKNID